MRSSSFFTPGQLPGWRIQVPDWCGFVPGFNLPGRTCIPAWRGDWPVTVLECKYIKFAFLASLAGPEWSLMTFCSNFNKVMMQSNYSGFNVYFPCVHIASSLVDGTLSPTRLWSEPEAVVYLCSGFVHHGHLKIIYQSVEMILGKVWGELSKENCQQLR